MINILLATYNGEKYLPAQLDSLLAQTFEDFYVYVRDDGSEDKTKKILAEYAGKYPGKIRLIPNSKPSGSAKNNFFAMINEGEYAGEYFMFCDQDDVWHPDKIKITYEKMIKKEYNAGKSCPVLIHTDLQVVDEELQIKAPSFARYQGLKPRKARTLQSLLVQNNITGCTVMVNRSLFELAKIKDTGSILMHDWWMGLIAAAFGEISFINHATICYRQHGGNQVGAKNVYDVKYITRQIGEKLRKKGKYQSTGAQAEAFYKRFKEQLNTEQKVLVQKYVRLPHIGKVARCIRVIKHQFWMQGFSRRIAQLFFG